MTAQTTTKAKADKTTPAAPAPADTANPAPQAPVQAASAGEEGAQGTYRGWVIERPGAKGEQPSYYRVGEGWTWDKDKATNFAKKEDAKALLQKKRAGDDPRPAGPASNENAKIVKFDEGADD
jgi:hypothetical protein